MLLITVLKNWLKPWPVIHEKNMTFDNVQVKSAFDTFCIREEKHSPQPKRAQTSSAKRSARATALRRTLTPQKCPAASWLSNPKAMKGQMPEPTVIFFLPHLLSWEIRCFKSHAAPRISCPRRSITQYWCKIQSAHLC